MFLPEEYVWLEPVIVAAVIVFAVDLVGNSIAYGGRLVNAFTTAIVFLLVFAALAYFGLGKLEVSTDAVEIPTLFLPPDYLWLEPVLIATAIVFVVGLVGNILSFQNRFMNAVATAIIFLVVFGAVTYLGHGSLEVVVPTLPSGEIAPTP